MRRLKLVKLRDHVVLKHVEIPESHKQSYPADKHALHTTDIRQEVKEGVDVSGNDLLVEIHFDTDVHLYNEVFFIGHHRLLVELKHGTVA